MNGLDLKKAVSRIELDDISKQEMIQNLKAGRKTARGSLQRMKGAAAAAIFVLGLGAVGIPAYAFVTSALQARMEEIPQEELQAAVDLMESQNVGGDSFSRSYTEAEKERMAALRMEYLEGRFPEGELFQASGEMEAKDRELYFLTTTSRFYLPQDRELTDEELLEIIDFNEKRDYALQANRAGDTEEAKQAQTQAAAGAAVTEQEAVDIAAGYLQEIFGIDGSGRELNHYYSAAGEMSEEAAYQVNWSIQSWVYHYFTIGAEDGKLLRVSCSDAYWNSEEYQTKKPALQDASERAVAVREQAEAFLKDTLGIDEEYEKVETCYYTYNDEEVGGFIDLLFLNKDGEACRMSYSWEGDLREYSQTTEEDFEKRVELMQEYGSAELTEERGTKVTVKVVME